MFDIKTCFGQDVEREETKCSKGISALVESLPNFDSFCMPGHKGALTRKDLTELDGGNIFPSSSIKNAQNKAAKIYSVKACRFLTGGASQGIKAAVMAVGGDIIAPSFTHRSVKEGTLLSGKRYITFDSGIDENGLPRVPTLADYEKAIDENPHAKAVVVTSPDYFGRVAPVEKIAKLCHEKGKLLIADCAHGAHFAFRKDIFPKGGESVADFSVLSTHKTLRALTQSAIGVVNAESYLASYDQALALLGTTSPSYLLLSSIESAIDYEVENAKLYDALVTGCNEIRKNKSCLCGGDPLRLTVKFSDGKKAFDELVKKGIMPEAYYGDTVVFIVTLSDDEEKIKRLNKAMENIL
jgi:arginine/lysine/ornithine decarboxylase